MGNSDPWIIREFPETLPDVDDRFFDKRFLGIVEQDHPKALSGGYNPFLSVPVCGPDRCNAMKGSMTIEAAYLFPMIFLILGIVCFLGIYQYDRAVFEMTACECILKSTEQELPESTLKELMYERAQSAAQERALGVKQLHTEVYVTSSSVTVTYQCIMNIFEIPLKVTVSHEQVDPEQMLWTAGRLTGEN